MVRGLTPAQAKTYRVMDNRSSENAEWDEALLGLELGDLQGEGFDLGMTGFDDEQLNRLLAALGERFTGKAAVLDGHDQSFDDLKAGRSGTTPTASTEAAV